MKVLFFTNVPVPYTTDFFNELGKFCELTVIYERRIASDRNKDWSKVKDYENNFKSVYLKGLKKGPEQALSLGIFKFLRKNKYDHIIFGNFTTPTGILGVFWLKFFRRKYILFSEGGIKKNGKGFKEKFKKFLIRNSYLYLSTSNLGDDYFIAYGANKKNIKRIKFTSLFEKDIKDNFVKTKNKIPIIITVGRFIKSKGFERLIGASIDIFDKYPHYLYIVGEGEQKDIYLEIIKKGNIKHIEIFDFMTKEQLIEKYDSSDIFVLPTEYDTWGLVIIEAMSRGLPVITTKTCVSGVELISNENGKLYDYEDVESLKKHLIYYINDEFTRIDTGINNINKIRDYTIESMAKEHIDILQQYINENN